ncbi:DNA repair protein RadC [Clostridium sp. SHJSY1]|uniref:RadC family protein n=1 Tax=Clostridium sp. SHJSY1 TaxID=2942483 RepID=UPI0028750A4E|nr:DNA repair protein RadC [Clostridium sp. SHJSY1]MDS0528011.1 DNA repair protein RadC [Clostridium sp. SHJSY1]
MDNNLKIMEIPINERPVEKLINFGAETLNNQELLAVILRCGTRGQNILTLSEKILSEVNGLNGILTITYDEIKKIKGIKTVKASQILALAELFRRFNTLKADSRITINSPKDIAEMLMIEMADLNQEVLKLIVLSTKNKIIKVKDVFKGTLNSSLIHPREIYCEAIKSSGASIIICHNHPSGDPNPSEEDINITLRLIECGKIIGINLLDHIIVGNKKYLSLKEKGII